MKERNQPPFTIEIPYLASTLTWRLYGSCAHYGSHIYLRFIISSLGLELITSEVFVCWEEARTRSCPRSPSTQSSPFFFFCSISNPDVLPDSETMKRKRDGPSSDPAIVNFFS
jgi:hypothetical protein